jgi:YVTN family beta-propeller protein
LFARQQAIKQIKRRRNLWEKGAKIMRDIRLVSAPSNLTHRVLLMGTILIGSAAMTTMGALPAAAATPFAYVANSGSNTVSIINTATGAVVATVSVGTTPTGVAITPNGSAVYVTNAGSNTVSIINTITRKVTATVSVGSGPNGVAITPNGAHAYVANGASGTVSIVNPVTQKVTATVSVGSTPTGVAITPNGSAVYVNTVSQKVTATVPVGTKPIGVAMTAHAAYVANNGSDTLSIINTVTQKVTTVGLGGPFLGTNPYGVAISPSGSKAYVTMQDSVATCPAYGGEVEVVSTYTQSLTDDIGSGFGGGLTGVAFVPGQYLAYVTETCSNNVAQVNTYTELVGNNNFVTVGSGPQGVAIR